MASRAFVPVQNRAEGEKQKKNAAPEGRNRRVLRDIGNLANVPPVAVVEAKKSPLQINRPPVTRSFCAQMLKNAQGEAEKQKPTTEKILIENPVIKRGKTLTSILNARSKAVCDNPSNKPKDPIVDIDAKDVNNELAIVEYVDDIYKFYKQSEEESLLFDYMSAQVDINSRMRTILVDWLVEVHSKFELMPETLYLTVNIIDRYLAAKAVSRRELQLVGISSMLIACKYEEIWAPEVNDFVCVSAKAYTGEQVLAMEKSILGKLEWFLTVPTPYVFLVRYIKACVSANNEIKNLAFFFAELALMHYSAIMLYRPSMIAAAAVYAARCTLNKSCSFPSWTNTLKHHTGYTEEQLIECAKQLVHFHSEAAESKHKAVYKKFSNPDRDMVALQPLAASLAPSST